MSDVKDQPEKRRLGCGAWLLIVGGLGVLTVFGAFAVFSISASNEVAAEMALIRAAGEPVTAEDLEEYYGVSPEASARAELWLAAMDRIKTPEYEAAAENLPLVGLGNDIPPAGEPWPDLEAAEKLLADYDDVLKQLHEAAEAGGPVRYPVDFSQGYEMTFAHAQHQGKLRRLLALDAHVRSHRGDPAGAARSIRTGLALGDSLKQEPIIIAQSIRMSSDNTAAEELAELLTSTKFSEEDLVRFQGLLREKEYLNGVERAMMGERVMVTMAIDNPDTMFGKDKSSGMWRIPVVVNKNKAAYLRYMRHTIAAGRKPRAVARNEIEQVENDFDAEESNSIVGRMGVAMGPLITPAHGMFLKSADVAAVVSRCVDTTIAVERFQDRQGRLPKSLDELVPDFLPVVPTDPFDGKPLRYVIRDGKYIIYSVGRDGKDDGGRDDEGYSPDIVFPPDRREPIDWP